MRWWINKWNGMWYSRIGKHTYQSINYEIQFDRAIHITDGSYKAKSIVLPDIAYLSQY